MCTRHRTDTCRGPRWRVAMILVEEWSENLFELHAWRQFIVEGNARHEELHVRLVDNCLRAGESSESPPA